MAYVGCSQHGHAAIRYWIQATSCFLIYDIGVSRHEDPKSWFWLRGADGAARALAAVRHQTGLTQAQIAGQLDMDRTTVLNMEAGRNPAVNRFISLFNWMGYDLIAVPRGARVIVDTRANADADAAP
jgi:Helix-turn-helix domain